jgi:hypothetical protein
MAGATPASFSFTSAPKMVPGHSRLVMRAYWGHDAGAKV